MRNNVLTAPNGFRYKRQYHTNVVTGEVYKYLALSSKLYYSERYNKYINISCGDRSDGATGAFDIISFAWWAHDKLCKTGEWVDGTKCTNWQASMVIFDILKSEGHWLRDFWWFAMTFLYGGGEARKNGMFVLKSEVRNPHTEGN